MLIVADRFFHREVYLRNNRLFDFSMV